MKNEHGFCHGKGHGKKYGGMVTSFTLHREGETDQSLRGGHRILIEIVALLALLAAAAGLLRYGYHRYMRAAYPLEYSEIVTTYAAQYDFEPSLVYALIRTESGFDPNAVSSADAFGLMQITRDTFEWAQSRTSEKETLPVNELFNPEVNIHYGVLVLSMLREEFSDSRTMLAAYNAGIGNVRRWLKDSAYSDDGVTLRKIPFPETSNYVEKIPEAQAVYEELYKFE